MAKKRKDPLESVVLDAAEHVFGRKGYQQTTMEALAKQADISVGTLYNLFKSKEDIYTQAARRIGESVVRRVETLSSASTPEEAVLDVVRLRLCNYVTDRLFFQPFCVPGYLGIQPAPESLGPEVVRLHDRYVDRIEEIFARCRTRANQAQPQPVKMAAYLEGIIHAFMGYWSGPLQSDELAKAARQITSVLFCGIAPRAGSGEVESPPPADVARSIHISRYDLERLKDLMDVIRGFGKKDVQLYVDALEKELMRAQITNPKEVPPDVVTMNSRVRVTHMMTGDDRVCSLVFPRDAHVAPENVSILSPWGIALIGRRLGDVFTVDHGGPGERYHATQLLYQPEAAGDYHL